ncbi:MAG: hypothetical protein ACE5H9_02930 [Anaerolineae bacterium]
MAKCRCSLDTFTGATNRNKNAEGNRISSLTRVKGHKEDTILSWLREAAQHAQALEDVLMKDFRVKRGQLEGLWAYVGNKGEKKLRGNS